ncbi:hypothetical protein [Paracoccus methylarcula]|nr:hypothetical protein [Paracoccus methylarcula]
MAGIKIHIGHGKTGSSYLQAALAASEAELSLAGYCYPLHEQTKQKALRGETTSGNVRDDKLAEFLTKNSCPPDHKLLVSNEGLFLRFASGEGINTVLEKFSPPDVSILLMVRNPLENAASSYLQAVQKRTFSGHFESALRSFNQPANVARVIRNCRNAGIDLEVKNYSRHRHEILKVVSHWLGVDLNRPKQETINRSLTSTEAEIQRRLNKMARDPKVLAMTDRIIEELPDIIPDKPKVAPEVISAFFDRIREQVDEVHNLLGVELYQRENSEPYTCLGKPKYFLESEQIEFITKIMASHS